MGGADYLEGHNLEEVDSNKKGLTFKISKKRLCFYKESVVYPFVQAKESKKGYFITSNDYVDILNYVEHKGLSHI